MPNKKLNGLETFSTSSTPSGRMPANRRQTYQPFTSSPVTMNVPPFRLSLDESLEMQDFCDRFERGVTVNAIEVEGVGTWKKDEIVSRGKQLDYILSPLVHNIRRCSGDWHAENPVLTSLAKSLALLEPYEITTAGVASTVALRYHRQLEKKKLLASLKSQTAELQVERKRVSDATMDIRQQIQNTKEKLHMYQDEIIGTDTKEVMMLTDAYQVEIDALAEQYTRIEAMETACSETKINQTISEITSLHKRAETLSKELEFAKVLPPNIRQTRILVDQRKQHLQDTADRLEDAVEFQYRQS